MDLKKLWRDNPLRGRYLRAKQAVFLTEVRAAQQSRAVVFLVAGRDRVNGGIISIVSLAAESAKLKQHHGAGVFVCTVPGDPLLYRLTKFANDAVIVELELLLRTLQPGTEILVHIPEIFVERFGNSMQGLYARYPGMHWQFNILLQNIDLIPKRSQVQEFSGFGAITCTTAHKAYANEQTAEVIGCPVYHFSTWVSPEKYLRKSYAQKENLIVVSPDKHPLRKEVLASLKEGMPNYRFQVVRKLTYEQFKQLIAQAKFSLTFGEGLDGYLIEPVFAGAIGAAVYNDRFFTEDLKALPFIYSSMEELMARLPGDAASADNEQSYAGIQLRQFEQLAAYYSHDTYVSNLVSFYRKHFLQKSEVPS